MRKASLLVHGNTRKEERLRFNSGKNVFIDNVSPFVDLQLTGLFDYNIEDNQIIFNSGSVGITLNYNFID